jgi:hypothetical protein
LSRHAPLPSMLIAMPLLSSRPVNCALVPEETWKLDFASKSRNQVVTVAHAEIIQLP